MIDFENKIKSCTNANFDLLAIEVYNYQKNNNSVYAQFLKAINKFNKKINSIEDIPFLPIELFKTKIIKSTELITEKIFTSSGTTGEETSKHHVVNVDFYLKHSEMIFEQFYGKLNKYVFLCLLPSYLERDGSSLIAMANYFIENSADKNLSGFYLDDYKTLLNTIELARKKKLKIILLGVTFALLDFAELHKFDFSDSIVIETGGMKGRRKEMLREEVHSILKKSWNLSFIHSEYGMTELLSQAYSIGNGIFKTPACMKILIRDTSDPFCILDNNLRGGINIIDLANFNSCSFIETKDLGLLNGDEFYVLGRFDHTDLRGCNLLLNI